MINETVKLTCEKDIESVERILSRAGKYIDQGYKLDLFNATDEGLEIILIVKKQELQKIGF